MKRWNGFFVSLSGKLGQAGVFGSVLGMACLAAMFGVRSNAAVEEHASPQVAEVVELRPVWLRTTEEGVARVSSRQKARFRMKV